MKFALTLSLAAIFGLVAASPVPQAPGAGHSPCYPNAGGALETIKGVSEIYWCTADHKSYWIATFKGTYGYDAESYKQAAEDLCADRSWDGWCFKNFLMSMPVFDA